MYHTLLVDDQNIFIRELERLPVWGEKSGFVVSGKAKNGMEALELVRARQFHLVITDIRMPKLDGIRLLAEIKRENLCPCVSLMSEHREFSLAREGLVCGAFDYIVKPVEAQSIERLFKRVASYLNSLPLARQSGEEADREALFYPELMEAKCISLFLSQNEELTTAFLGAARQLQEAYAENGAKADLLLARLYLRVVEAVFSNLHWLENFIDRGEIETISEDLSSHGVEAAAQARSMRLGALLDIVKRFQPVVAEGVIKSICDYILNNPEANLKLTAMAEQFYMNHTYLSNMFRQKTGVSYNEYITAVKIERAKYLLKHTDLKIYEICVMLGYQDSEYFGELFKRHCGQSQSDYKKSSVSGNSHRNS